MTNERRRVAVGIKARRTELGMTQAQFAKACEMDLDRFRRLESGRQEPTASDLAALSRQMDVRALISMIATQVSTDGNGIAQS